MVTLPVQTQLTRGGMRNYRSTPTLEGQTREQEKVKITRMEQHPDQDSDNEDDPTKLLNQWLGELNTLKRVNY